LKRVIQKELVDKLALALLRNDFGPGDHVRIDARDGALVFETVPASADAAPVAA
jgi:ATP-dependent Clp protease ATP-binding subunit ClpA